LWLVVKHIFSRSKLIGSSYISQDIFLRSFVIAYIMASVLGGQPDEYTSTGINLSMPQTIL